MNRLTAYGIAMLLTLSSLYATEHSPKKEPQAKTGNPEQKNDAALDSLLARQQRNNPEKRVWNSLCAYQEQLRQEQDPVLGPIIKEWQGVRKPRNIACIDTRADAQKCLNRLKSDLLAQIPECERVGFLTYKQRIIDLVGEIDRAAVNNKFPIASIQAQKMILKVSLFCQSAALEKECALLYKIKGNKVTLMESYRKKKDDVASYPLGDCYYQLENQPVECLMKKFAGDLTIKPCAPQRILFDDGKSNTYLAQVVDHNNVTGGHELYVFSDAKDRSDYFAKLTADEHQKLATKLKTMNLQALIEGDKGDKKS